MTREAFALYLGHLAPDGILVAHISNRHLDLKAVFWQQARAYGLSMLVVDRFVQPNDDGFPSQWVVLARDPASLQIPALQARVAAFDGSSVSLRLWTDDYSNLFQILK